MLFIYEKNIYFSYKIIDSSINLLHKIIISSSSLFHRVHGPLFPNFCLVPFPINIQPVPLWSIIFSQNYFLKHFSNIPTNLSPSYLPFIICPHPLFTCRSSINSSTLQIYLINKSSTQLVCSIHTYTISYFAFFHLSCIFPYLKLAILFDVLY